MIKKILIIFSLFLFLGFIFIKDIQANEISQNNIDIELRKLNIELQVAGFQLQISELKFLLAGMTKNLTEMEKLLFQLEQLQIKLKIKEIELKIKELSVKKNLKTCQEEIITAQLYSRGKICTEEIMEMDCDGLMSYTAINGCEISFLKNRGWVEYKNLYGDAPYISSISSFSGSSDDWITIRGKNLIDTVPSAISIEFLQNGKLKGSIGHKSISLQSNGLSLKFQLIGILVENIGSGKYQIRVLNDNGESNLVDFEIIENNQEKPYINKISPSMVSINDLITIRGKNLLGTVPSGISIELIHETSGVETVISTPSFNNHIINESEDGSSLEFQLPKDLIDKTGPGRYKVRVMNDTGISNVSDLDVTKERSISSISVISPNRNTGKLETGKRYTINWNHTNLRGKSQKFNTIMIELLNESCSEHPYIITRLYTYSSQSGSYSWLIPQRLFDELKSEFCTKRKINGWQSGDNFKIRISEVLFWNEDFSYMQLGAEGITPANFNIIKSDSIIPSPVIFIESNPRADSYGNVSVSKGDKIIITGLPANLSKDYKRAFFFDSIFDASCTNTEWVMTCIAGKAGVSNFYIEVYQDGKTYRSNKIKVIVSPYVIKSFIGNQPNYYPESWINVNLKAQEWNNSIASPDKGFNVQAYIYEEGKRDRYLTPNPSTSYNAKYNHNTENWEVKMIGPKKTGWYDMEIVLYCSQENSYCSREYGEVLMGNYYENKIFIKFNVVNEIEEVSLSQLKINNASNQLASIIQGFHDFLKKLMK